MKANSDLNLGRLDLFTHLPSFGALIYLCLPHALFLLPACLCASRTLGLHYQPSKQMY